MAQTLEQLGQARPANTSNAVLVAGAASTEKLIKSIIVCNTSAAAAAFRLFHDDDGTTYDETSALCWDIEIPAGKVATVELNICMDNSAGNLAIRSSVASALTFTAYGSLVT